MAILATLLSMAIGVVVGMIAGYYRGWTDAVLSRVIDVVLAFPILLLAVGIAAACSLGEAAASAGAIKPGLGVVILVIVVVNWTYIARIIRGQVLSLREKEFVEASRSLGASNRRILARDILPNLVAPIIVYSTLLIPQNILLEAALSFLGVGVQPPTATWGAMIARATEIFDSAWWYMAFPGRGAAAHGAGLQPARRRIAGRPRPEGEQMNAGARIAVPYQDRRSTRKERIGMHRFSGAVALIVCLALVATGCGDDKKSDSGGAPDVTDTSGKSGGHLDVLSIDDITSLDPGYWYYAYDYQALHHPTQRSLYGWQARPTPSPRPTSRRRCRRPLPTARP